MATKPKNDKAKQPQTDKAKRPTKDKATTTATANVEPVYEAPKERNTFPVSFVIIAASKEVEDGTLQRCIGSLPNNAEVCILTNSRGDDNTITNVSESVGDRQIIRSRHWTCPENQFSFATARNYAQMMATKEWLFWIDCDELLAHAQHDGIAHAAISAGPGVGGYYAGQLSLSRFATILEQGAGEYHAEKQLRLYRKHPGVYWEGHAHEQIAHRIRACGYTVVESSIGIIHNGYSLDDATLVSKVKRNYTLIGRWMHENGDTHELSRYYRETLGRDLSAYNLLEKKTNGSI